MLFMKSIIYKNKDNKKVCLFILSKATEIFSFSFFILYFLNMTL